MVKLFQPLLWAFVGAAVAGGLFFLLDRPQGGSITIVVPTPTATPLAASRPPAPTPEQQRININTASAKALENLPGIGPVKAQAIVDYRNQQGLFRRTDELMNVPGIGPATYQALRDLVTVEDHL